MDGLQEAFASVSSNVVNNWQNIIGHCGRQLQPWQREVSNLVAGVQSLNSEQRHARQRRQERQIWMPAFAVRSMQQQIVYAQCHS
jgi:hypothetical protein